jgi:flagellar basal-body rod protein FlgB
VLAENISNSNTPGFKPRDLVEPNFSRDLAAGAPVTLAMTATNPGHIRAAGGAEKFGVNRGGGYETRPAGNAVSLEDEMMKVSSNQMDYAAVTSLYSRSLGLLKTAIGKR